MTSYDQFNNWLSQQDNCISRYRSDTIALDIEIIAKCEDIYHDERRNARKVQRNQWHTDVIK